MVATKFAILMGTVVRNGHIETYGNASSQSSERIGLASMIRVKILHEQDFHRAARAKKYPCSAWLVVCGFLQCG